MNARDALIRMNEICRAHGAGLFGMRGDFTVELPGGRSIISKDAARNQEMTIMLANGATYTVMMWSLELGCGDLSYNWNKEPEGDDLVEIMMVI